MLEVIKRLPLLPRSVITIFLTFPAFILFTFLNVFFEDKTWTASFVFEKYPLLNLSKELLRVSLALLMSTWFLFLNADLWFKKSNLPWFARILIYSMLFFIIGLWMVSAVNISPQNSYFVLICCVLSVFSFLYLDSKVDDLFIWHYIYRFF